MARQVGPKNVVGREKLIEKIWKKLETRSLQFTAERRVGKTTVMTKMDAEPNAGGNQRGQDSLIGKTTELF